jgi:hypothetical protein
MKRKPRTPELQEALADHFFEAINDGSDLVCAIVGAATVIGALDGAVLADRAFGVDRRMGRPVPCEEVPNR